MEALLKPIRNSKVYTQVKEKGYPAYVYGTTSCVRSILMEALRGDSQYTLIVAGDSRRAEKLYQEYKLLDRDVYVYPAKDALFYFADIHGNLTSAKRLEIVKRIYKKERTVIITTIEGLMDKLPDIKYFCNHAFTLKVGDEMPIDEVKDRLTMLGYENVPVVESRGQFSVRGGIIDIYLLTEECPNRLEFFGDEVESIRYFDEESQRSIESCQEIEILPSSEYVLSQARKERGIKAVEDEGRKVIEVFRKRKEEGAASRLETYVKNVRDEIIEYDSKSGLDSLVTYFFGTTVSFLDYLPEDTKVFIDDPDRVVERGRGHETEFKNSMESRLSSGYILPGQAGVIYPHEEIIERLKGMNLVLFSEFYTSQDKWGISDNGINFDTKHIDNYKGDFSLLIKDIKKWKNEGNSILIISPSQTRAKNISASIMDENIVSAFTADKNIKLIPGDVIVTTGYLEEGYRIPEIGIVVIAENEIFGAARMAKKRKSFSKKYEGEKIRNIDEITVGDYVVHEKHGVGIYRGIEKKKSLGRYRDYIQIDYADNAKLFIPVDQFGLIGKLADKDAGNRKLSKLGGNGWTKTKNRVKSHVDDIAEELIDLYAMRQQKKGFKYSEDTLWQKEFEELFPYEETHDQYQAIMDTKKDMESDKIMDRLICGDVGFGKTEVAIRAAFKAVQDGKQVAYLVPTTILAEQHYNTFAERFKGYPIEIRQMSRFCSTSEVRQTIEDLKAGKVDVVIGTHRLLSKDVAYKSLGLLIIDEEQRFGVKHKEKIKQLKDTVDVLTLTATPIPRTLHMSLIGIRDMSLLEEPPVDRRPIQTYVMEYDNEIVKEAINRELSRGGQVYYVYNKVSDIDSVTMDLRSLLPNARVEFAHGQMNERDLENIMHAFINREIDVLVSTTIIETGLDIPNVNTIIIHNADRFGLAQLYQLRGRVGRSDRTAFAFLMYQKDKVIKEVAEKRLSAIREFTELGSGYKISMKDLEIRGAGNVLGSSQSGNMMEIGYDLYVKILNKAIRTKLGQIEEEEDFDTSIDLPVDAHISDKYVMNEYRKLEMYKKISRIKTEDDIADLCMDAEDRFGFVPDETRRLMRIALIKAKAQKAHIITIRFRNDFVEYIIKDGTRVESAKLTQLMKKYTGQMYVVATKESGLKVKTESLFQDEMLNSIETVVDDIYEFLFKKTDSVSGTDDK
ncbi:MAG: transcription-repair coupling factor [Eubacterium sp.]|nr:transcription-repair coupling factor [Eubacterium sp.]